jgi:hypothetical protein
MAVYEARATEYWRSSKGDVVQVVSQTAALCSLMSSYFAYKSTWRYDQPMRPTTTPELLRFQSKLLELTQVYYTTPIHSELLTLTHSGAQ